VGRTLEKLRSVARNRLGGTLWSILKLEWSLPSGLKVTVGSFAEWITYNDIFVDGEYDVAIRHAVQHSTPGSVVLDVGGNVGYFALRFADLWLRERQSDEFRLVGVEGSPHTFAMLQSRLRQGPLNGHTDYRFGLAGKREGQARISTSRFHVTDSIVMGDPEKGTPVPFLDLSSVVPADARIALLKCDIEGAEQMFLENYPDLLRRTDSAVIELQHQICDTKLCVRLLEEAGLVHAQRLRDFSPSATVDFFVRPNA